MDLLICIIRVPITEGEFQIGIESCVFRWQKNVCGTKTEYWES